MTTGLYTFKIRVIRVIDGDTLEGEIELGFGVFMRKKVRIENINTPELRGKDHQQAVQATHSLQQLLNGRQTFITSNEPRYDQYGRVLAHVLVMGQNGRLVDAGDFLIQEGLARPWR